MQRKAAGHLGLAQHGVEKVESSRSALKMLDTIVQAGSFLAPLCDGPPGAKERSDAVLGVSGVGLS